MESGLTVYRLPIRIGFCIRSRGRRLRMSWI